MVHHLLKSEFLGSTNLDIKDHFTQRFSENTGIVSDIHIKLIQERVLYQFLLAKNMIFSSMDYPYIS